jgi:hypothetical protein
MMTRGKPFGADNPGNPAGRPKGSRNRASRLAELIQDADAEAIAQSVIGAAVAGDMTAARLVLDRLAPIRRGAPITFDLPTITSEADAVTAMSGVLAAVAEGQITPEEGQAVAALIASFLDTVKTNDHAQRLRAIEERLGPTGGARP